MNTGASVVTLDPKTIPGGSLAEHLFHLPVNGKVICDHCNLAVFELVGVGDSAAIKIYSRHYGSKHISFIPIEKIGLRLA